MASAFQNLIITNKRNIEGITIDGVITENTVRQVRVTSNPVEDGVNISDHVIEEPLRYSMTGVVTDTPIGAAAFSEIGNTVIDLATGLFGQSESSGVTRSKQAYLELKELMRKRELITVETSLEKYDDLIFESINVNTDKSTANAIHFSATFIQVLIVKTSRQEVDSSSIDSLEESAAFSSKTNAGFNPTVPATDTEVCSIVKIGGQ